MGHRDGRARGRIDRDGIWQLLHVVQTQAETDVWCNRLSGRDRMLRDVSSGPDLTSQGASPLGVAGRSSQRYRFCWFVRDVAGTSLANPSSNGLITRRLI